MNLDEVVDIWIADSKVDETELSRESLKTPLLHAKYLKMYSEEAVKLKSLYVKRKRIQNTLNAYYKGDLNNPEDLKEIDREPWSRKVLRQEVQEYVDADEDMVKINIRIGYQEEIVSALKEIIKAINTRGFAIKNAIDFLKWSGGG